MQRGCEINRSKTSLKPTKLSEGAVRGTVAEHEAAEAPAASGFLPVDVNEAQLRCVKVLQEKLRKLRV